MEMGREKWKEKMKGSEIAASLAIVLSLLCLLPVGASAQAVVAIENASALPNETTTTNVTAYNVTNLGNFGITVTYDPSVVNVTNVTGGPGVGTFGWKRISDGEVRFYTVNVLEEMIPSLSGNVTLATLTLKAVGAAGSESPLNLEIGQLLDNKSNPIPAIPKNGTFKVLTPEEVAYITVSPSAATLNVGETRVFTATAYDGDGNPLEGVLINWTSTNETVGTVRPTTSITDENGVARTNFTAISPGNTTVTAGNLTDAGWIIGYADVTVIPTDTTPPTTEVMVTPPEPATGWWNSSVMLTFHRYDDLSGVNFTAYRMAGATTKPWTQVFGEENFTVNITAEGITTVYYLSWDKAGNMEIPKSMNVSIDRTSPVIISVEIDRTRVLPGDIINVTVKANDALSGILEIRADGIPLTHMEDFWYGNITAASSPGTYNVTVEAIDRAWNIAVNDSVQYVVVKEPSRLTRIVVEPSEVTLNVGETREIIAIAYDQYNETMPDIVISWVTKPTGVGTVRPTTSITDENGIARTNFTATAPGNTTVIAVNLSTRISNLSRITVIPVKNLSVDITISPRKNITVNRSATVTVNVTDEETGVPVEGANVNLSGCGVSLINMTDASGIATFEVSASKPGNITVRVTKSGYKDWEGNISVYAQGDVNGDSEVLPSDAMAVLRIWAGIDSPENYTGADPDVNGDGSILPSDALEILRIWATKGGE